jgi:hypothetical protein
MAQRRAAGRSTESIDQDADQFSAIALAIDPTYAPPWTAELQSIDEPAVGSFWLAFGELNQAVFPALACKIRGYGEAERDLATALAAEAGLYGVTHAALVPAVLDGQGCDHAGALPMLDEVCPAVADELTEVERFLMEERTGETSPSVPNGLGDLSPLGRLDAAASLGLGSVVCGGSNGVGVEIVRRLVAEFEPDGVLGAVLTGQAEGRVKDWHAVLLTASFLGVVGDERVEERVSSAGR